MHRKLKNYSQIVSQELKLFTQNQQDKGISNCLHLLIESQVEKTPDKVAVMFKQQQLTYRELNERGNQLAYYLQTLGVGCEVMVGLCIERSPVLIIAMLAVLKAGGAYIPLDPNYPQERLEFMIEDSQLSIILTQKSLIHLFSDNHRVQVIDLDITEELTHKYSKKNPETTVYPENLAYTIYTSGSTGKPKGVQIEHHSVVNFLMSMRSNPGINPEDIFLAITTICFDIAVLEIFLPLIVGAKAILVSQETVKDASKLIKILADSQATIMQATPTTWQMLIAGGWTGNKKLKMLCGGEAMGRSLANNLLKLGGCLWNMYGPTETTVWSAVSKVEIGDDSASTISIDHPIANTEIHILDITTHQLIQPTPIGQTGEVCISGDGVARGYLNRPELNSEKFTPNLYSQQLNSRLYKTGDLGRYLPDGTIQLIGRIDQQVKIRGFRIELGDIENTISEYPGIREVAVIAKEDNSGHQSIAAYISVKTKVNELDTVEEEINQNKIQQWQQIWNHAYSQGQSSEDAEFNISGWNDSYTGTLTSPQQMREWVNCTVERILQLQPRSILEIGCGTGLLLFQLASHSDRYHGIDMSSTAIAYIQQHLQQRNWSHVSVEKGTADNLDKFEFEETSFDTIIINSVIQYFPNFEYLVTVLKAAVKLVKSEGKIFLGDIRSLPLLEAFHTSVEFSKPNIPSSVNQLLQNIKEGMGKENELVIHPDFFHILQQFIPEISYVDIQLRRGEYRNELNNFRYDVILSINSQVNPIIKPICFNWQQTNLSIPSIREYLSKNSPEALFVTSIPNARVILDILTLKEAYQYQRNISQNTSQNTSQNISLTDQRNFLKQQTDILGIDPEDIWNLVADFAYYINISPSKEVECYDALFVRKPFDVIDIVPQESYKKSDEINHEIKNLGDYTNNPHQQNQGNHLITGLRKFLKDKLPDYMIPSHFKILESMPLTLNGKIDRKSLPEIKQEKTSLNSNYVPPSTTIEKSLTEILSNILGIENIGIKDNFFEMGGNSLLAITLLAEVEKKFNLQVPLFYLLKEPTVIGLIKGMDIVQEIGTQQAITNINSLDLEAEAILDSRIVAETVNTTLETKLETIFLTGATGFLGAFLLSDILKRTPANVYCLVRAENFEKGIIKIKSNLEKYLLWNSNFSHRIFPVLGDLSQDNLGLSSEIFDILASKVDIIFHCGAYVNLINSYNQLRATNVIGTQEILRLASKTKIKPVHYISTLDIFLSPFYQQQQVILEYDPLNHSQGLYNGYAQSKWVGDKLAIAARDRGIPVTIYRPGMITGHSQTGVSQTNDLICRMIKGFIQLQAAPILQQSINMAPVDYVSEGIVNISLDKESTNKTFHLLNPNPIDFSKLISLIGDFGYPLAQLEYEKWKQLLLENKMSQENSLLPLLSLFVSCEESKQTLFFETSSLMSHSIDFQNTRDTLSKTQLVCPPVNKKLLDKYFSYFNKIGFIEEVIGAYF